MKHILTIVEQLDRAAVELSIDHPINNRLALILIDNATEITLHGFIAGRSEMDRRIYLLQESLRSISKEAWQRYASDPNNVQVMTPVQRKRALGRSFEDKVKVLCALGKLTFQERQFVLAAHEYRNELYHIGLANDDIIRSIAGHYFLVACDFLIRMGNTGIWRSAYSSNDVYSEVAQRYIPPQDGPMAILNVKLGDLAEQLIDNLPARMPALAETLAQSAQRSIDQLLNNMEFLVRENPFGYDEEEMVETAQWIKDLSDELEQNNIDGLWVDAKYREQFAQVFSELNATWKRRFAKIPVNNWRKRAARIKQEESPLIALALFRHLRQDMQYLEEAIQQAVDELDQWIQQQIDIARGK